MSSSEPSQPDLEELLAQDQQELRDMVSEQFNVELPPVDVIKVVDRFGGPLVQANCSQEAGFNVRVTPDGEGLIYPDVPSSQQADLYRAAFTCQLQYPIDPRQTRVLPTPQASYLFRHWVDVTAPCVEALGYPVQSPPSETVWLAAYETELGYWTPIDEAYKQMRGEEDLIRDLHQACPMYPKDLFQSTP